MSISFQNVHKSFGPKKVLDGISFAVNPGEILFVLGKSGVGKSVTLKHIVGVLKCDQGSIVVEGEDVMRLNEEGLMRMRRKCGMVFQHPALLDSLSVFENVAFGLRSLKNALTEQEIRQRVIETLGIVNLGPEILEKKPQQISYGMQKRVSLARTVAPGPRYLLFDEPTTGLDPITKTAINELIRDLSRRLQVTSLVVSHDMDCALSIADRILVLDQGRILAHDTVPRIRASSEPLIVDFLKEAAIGAPL